MEAIEQINVIYDDRKVGTMRLYQRSLAAFEYDAAWLRDGFSISPFSLPLRDGLFIPKYLPFDGLYGVFADSLPDGWGRLLVDRMLRREREDPFSLDVLQRLAIVGESGMGALSYHPAHRFQTRSGENDFDRLAECCAAILHSETTEDLDMLFALGGSSGGARPKVLVRVDGEDWIVKFRSSVDPVNVGLMEYDYALCAKACGIQMPECRLLPSRSCEGYFAVKRFDRDRASSPSRIHMISASALLEVSHRAPSLDYHSLMGLTWQLTKNMQETEQLFRRMCFNVFAHNRDDHSNNFSYLYRNGRWMLSPAYDLTYSTSIGGEHATSVNGNGSCPGMEDLLAVSDRAGLNRTRAKETAEEIQQTVHKDLGKYIR